MTEEGKVIEIQDRIAVVSITKGERCEGCSACQSFSIGKNENIELYAKNLINAQVDDCVVVEISPKRVVTSSLLVFILPIISLFIGYIVGANFLVGLLSNQLSQEGTGIVSGFLFMFVMFLILFVIDRKISKGDEAFVVSFVND